MIQIFLLRHKFLFHLLRSCSALHGSTAVSHSASIGPQLCSNSGDVIKDADLLRPNEADQNPHKIRSPGIESVDRSIQLSVMVNTSPKFRGNGISPISTECVKGSVELPIHDRSVILGSHPSDLLYFLVDSSHSRKLAPRARHAFECGQILAPGGSRITSAQRIKNS
jgi:hypothetical protein